MSSSFPHVLKLKDIERILKDEDSGFELIRHKTISHKWILRHQGKTNSMTSYPLTAPKGRDTNIDRQRIKVIANHFGIDPKIFTRK